jgi:uncharacterized phiE125 gp8 family phage protein
MIGSECLIPPASEPLSIDEVKTWLKIDGGDEDLLIAGLISSARLSIEAITGLLLFEQTWRYRIEVNSTSRSIKLPHRPINTLIAAQRLDVGNNRKPIPLDGIVIDKSRPGMITIADKILLALTPGDQLEIDFLMGFGRSSTVIAAPLLTAMRLLISFWHERRGDEPSADPWPSGLNTLLQPFRDVKL